MSDQVLAHQLQAIDHACQRLQALAANDAKSSGILICIRSLLVKLLLDRSLQSQLDDEARARFAELSLHLTAELGDASQIASAQQDGTIMAAVSDAVVRLQTQASPGAAALTRRLLSIETQSLRAFEDAFRAASVGGAENQTGKSFNTVTLGKYLSTEIFAASELIVDAIEMISGGYSKLTLRARLRGADHLPATVVLRVDRPENRKLVGTQVADEYPLLMALHERGVRVPRPYALESSGAVVGAPAMVLDEVVGATVGNLFDFPPPSRELGVQLAQQLAMIHAMPESIAITSAGAPNPGMVGAIRQEIEHFRVGWKTLGRPSAILEAAFHCVDLNMHLAEGRRTFIHGDFGLHNILVDRGRITAVLDWEFARLAHPAVDLGWVYDTADHLVGWETFLSDYANAGGIVPPREQVNFYRLWGALRFAVLCAQVDAGFNAGQLSEIDYAVPGNRLLRIQTLRVAKALEELQNIRIPE